ncbi:DUF6708 domain-containing protein [Cobetia sp. 5-11-6-3]|uniref:DUF6708 domain-containing protein n=1 Tax=Cobetia sp. 5-11-6-3 TaxID=2737458 RepID=UPI001596DF34|nr:DUF6708 domain-containing protein [Cobetia sp. 5-11-6-3]
MDIKGLSESKYLRMPSDRKMNAYELSNILSKSSKGHDTPSDLLSVVEVNNTYMELVDRWYAHKGHTLLYAICLLGALMFGLLLFLFATISKNQVEAWFFYSAMVVITTPFLYMGIKGFLLEGFQKTYYPIRLDRIKKEIYVVLPKGGFLKADWDDLVIHVAKNKISMISGFFYEIRGYILDKESGEIKHCVTLGYPPWGGYEEALALWEFIRMYMEDGDGYKKCSKIIKVCMPIKHKKESVKFSIIRGMSLLAPNYVLQLLSSPIMVLFIWCRILSVKTSQLPVWPEWINMQHKNVAYDEYSKQSKDNADNNFWEETWPTICFVVGSLVSLALVLWAGYKYWIMYQ